MSGITTLREALGVDSKKTPIDDPHPQCPGARLRVTKQDFDDLVRGHEVFVTQRSELPSNGYGDARVRCTQLVLVIPSTAAKHRQYYGLCSSCSGLELDNRETLRQRHEARGAR